MFYSKVNIYVGTDFREPPKMSWQVKLSRKIILRVRRCEVDKEVDMDRTLSCISVHVSTVSYPSTTEFCLPEDFFWSVFNENLTPVEQVMLWIFVMLAIFD